MKTFLFIVFALCWLWVIYEMVAAKNEQKRNKNR
jgi:hypothetical protein